MSELLGKETIDTNSYGRSDGMRGNFSTNFQLSGRELMTPDEVRLLDNKYAIVFIRGEKPVLDLKYDLLGHPSIKLGADGGAEPYDHGKVEHEGLGIEIVDIADYPGMTINDFPKIDEYFADMYAFDEVEVETLCEYLETTNNEKEQEKA